MIATGANAGVPHDLSPDVWPQVEVGGDLQRAGREWLHTNGAGAYASSTLAGIHTRRYHGLLIAALDPPRARHVFLSHVDAAVCVPRAPAGGVGPASRPHSGKRWELSKHQFPGVDPRGGPFYLDHFAADPLPRWTHVVPAGSLEITLGLVRGENAVVLRYRWRGERGVRVALRPLLATREFHKLLREHGGMLHRVELRAGEVRVQPRREFPRVCFRFEGTFVGSPDWWRRFEYLAEQKRGLDYEEDLWTPGVFEMWLDGDAEIASGAGTHDTGYLLCAVDRAPAGEPHALLAAAESALRAEDPGPPASPLHRRLAIAGGAFRADLARHPGVIAGYPWFGVRGRDALIALPGLYLVPGKIDDAMRILRELIGHMQGGLVPNLIPDAGAAPDVFAADAVLWLFEAARMVADVLGDAHPFATDELLLALHDAYDAALRGTHNGVRITADGLFAAGVAAAPGSLPMSDAQTWMDARVRGRAVTPRVGCPVELSALWAKGCETLARLARAAGDADLHDAAAVSCQRARTAFRMRFWCAETSYPYDVISASETGDGAFHDASVRPNAVVALAVDPDCMTREQAELVIARARRDLLTPAGLRSLAPGDARYLGRYAGNLEQRDAAGHQGAAWPWLVGFYVRAARRLGHDRAPLERIVAEVASNELAVGQVPEIGDGDAPHAPGGSPAQARSVAELLRAIAWDLA